MKYRIVTNGHLFKVQEKFGLWWTDCMETDNFEGFEYTPQFSDVEIARQYKYRKEAVSFATAPWRVVE
jgi:hypothetical protein